MPADKPNRQLNPPHRQKPYGPRPIPRSNRRGFLGSLSDLLHFPAVPSASQMEPTYGQNQEYLEEHQAPMETDFAGQTANAEAGPSNHQNPLPAHYTPYGPLQTLRLDHHTLRIHWPRTTSNLETGPSHQQKSYRWISVNHLFPSNKSVSTPAVGQLSNTEAGPSSDQIPHHLGEYAAPTAGQLPNSQAGLSSHYPGDFAAPSQPLNVVEIPDCGDLDEDEGYYSFSNGVDNPAPIRRITKMVDNYLDEEVAVPIMEKGNFETVRDFRNALNGPASGLMVQNVGKAMKALKAVENTLAKKKQAVSFSKVLARDCEHLGLDTKSTPLSTTVVHQKVMGCLSNFLGIHLPHLNLSTTLRSAIHDTLTISDLAESIAQINRSNNDDKEAFSRKIIDQFTLAMHKVFKTLNLASYEIVELGIAFGDDPVNIVRDGFLTLLTGSTDYALFMQVGGDQMWLKDLCDTHKSNGVKELLEQLKVHNIRIFLIKAKSKDYSSPRALITCLPQVGVECIATMASTEWPGA
ncbi:hypothetical protein M413DRAFT_26904 [Hebeloma cylindrosporum]|uniref:Uncharacterized protein n=1 Tax=Hebeloma cylindrosporum TaxID=76867 RepID=A0A0C3CEQ5_HEBCY|nr:hypothetical protein M413DRAFT_26904 [Hebeloma cylindrosporum h7]